MIHPNILSAVGRTPLIKINRIFSKPGVTVAAKLESRNPGGSIKDRVALAMIEAAEARGELTPDKTIIEATSGNTGIGLAMVCAVKGYKLRLVMPASASEERRRIMRAYGADIQLTPGHLSTDGAIEEAYRLAREEPDAFVLTDQFNNPASIEAHYRSTAVEIWEDTEGKLTHMVATLGTSGTAMGLVKRLKEFSPAVQVVAVEPLPGHKIQGLKNMRESYPPGIYNKKNLDAVVGIEDEAAFEMARRLAREEGIFAGMSSGAAMAAAVRLAETLDSGLVVVILPDSGERYLSTTLFAPPQKRGLAVMDVASGDKVHPAQGASTGLFTVGPSLDAPGDPEAWRRILVLDALGRYLAREGAQVRLAVGLADLDDRTMNAAREAGLSQKAYSAQARARIEELAQALRLAPRATWAPASASTETFVGLADKLTRKGFAYERLRSVYFDVARDKRYGELLHTDLSKLSLGHTVDLEAYVKDNPKDFTLLKRASLQDLKKGEVVQTAWGNVRPSWFLQMAAVALDGLPNLSVFMAGEAHSFPHMENLRAIWSLGANAAPAAWMVCRGVSGLADVAETGMPMPAVRLWLLSSSYRKPLVYTPAALAMWLKNWRRVQETAAVLSEAQSGAEGKAAPEAAAENAKLGHALTTAFEDDLSLSRFWPVLFDFCRAANSMRVAGALRGPDAASMLAALRRADEVLAVLDESALPVPQSAWPEQVADLAAERDKARGLKDFKRADAIRDDIAQLGYRLEDTALGVRLFRA